MKSKIFVINLDRSPDRLLSIAKQFDELDLDFERVNAVDGKNLSEEQLASHYSSSLNKKHYFVSLSKNEIACYMSHLKALKQIIEEDLDYAIILEDDVILAPEFKYINEILESIKEPWDCIKLISPNKKQKVINIKLLSLSLDINSTEKKEFHFETLKWQKVPTGMVAYVITKEAALKYLNAYPEIFRPIDVDFQYPWEHNLNVIGLIPELISLDQSKESSIGHKKQKKYYPLARIIYKIKFFINSKLKS